MQNIYVMNRKKTENVKKTIEGETEEEDSCTGD